MLIETIYQQINNQFIRPQFLKMNKLQSQDISQINLIYFYENVD